MWFLCCCVFYSLKQGFGAGLFWSSSGSGNFFYPELAPGKREQNVGIFLKRTKNCLKYFLTYVPVHVGHILCLL